MRGKELVVTSTRSVLKGAIIDTRHPVQTNMERVVKMGKQQDRWWEMRRKKISTRRQLAGFGRWNVKNDGKSAMVTTRRVKVHRVSTLAKTIAMSTEKERLTRTR
jgi:hypothetical protein